MREYAKDAASKSLTSARHIHEQKPLEECRLWGRHRLFENKLFCGREVTSNQRKLEHTCRNVKHVLCSWAKKELARKYTSYRDVCVTRRRPTELKACLKVIRTAHACAQCHFPSGISSRACPFSKSTSCCLKS